MPSATPPGSPTPSSLAAYWRGVRIGMPVFLGYVPIGAAFGIVATATGFTLVQAVGASLGAYAGAGQFVAVDLIKAGVGVAGVLLATAVLNLRHVLFGATLAPYLRDTSRPMQAAIAFTMTDESFGVNITDLREGRGTPASMLGVGMIAWVGWAVGTAAGAGTAALIGDPQQWGIGFAMPAMFTALLVAQVPDRRHAAVALLAAALTLGLTPVLPGAWPLLLGSMGAATMATVVSR